MEEIIIKELNSYKATYKELVFSYKGLRFVYKFIITDNWEEGFLVDLNKPEQKLSEIEFNNLKEKIEQIDLDDIENN